MNIQKTFMPYFINLYEGTLGKVTRKSIFQNIKFVSPLKKSWLKVESQVFFSLVVMLMFFKATIIDPISSKTVIL